MLRRPWRFLTHRTGWPAVGGLLALIFVYYLLFFQPRTVALSTDAHGEAIEDPIPDGRIFSYNAADMQQLFARWQPSQLEAYQVSQIREDGLFPLIVALFYAVLLGNAFRGAFGDSDRGRWLLLLPLALLLADYSENLRLYWAVEQFRTRPAVPPSLADTAGICTSIKWAIVVLANVKSVVGFIWSRMAQNWPKSPPCPQ